MTVKVGLVAGLLMLVSACASAPSFQPPPPVPQAFLRERAMTKAGDGIRVSAAIPSREESQSIFGIDLLEKGIQPLWLEIENGSDSAVYFLPTGLDPEYFAPLEVAFLYKGVFADHAALGEHLQALHFDGRSPILAGTTMSGFVYLYAVEPSMVAQVDLLGQRWSKRFSLSVPVPGTESAQRRIAEMRSLYTPADFIDIHGERQLRAVLEDLPCCTSDESGARQGPPINLVLIGDFEDVAPAFVRQGYRYGTLRPLYAFGRPHDFSAWKRSRWVSPQPHTVRHWLTPLRYRGKSISVAQVSTRLGGRFGGPTEEAIEPDVDEARNDIVQDLLYSQSVTKIGFVKGAGRSPSAPPQGTHEGSTFRTDGLRAVMVFENETVSLSQIDLFDWERLVDHLPYQGTRPTE